MIRAKPTRLPNILPSGDDRSHVLEQDKQVIGVPRDRQETIPLELVLEGVPNEETVQRLLATRRGNPSRGGVGMCSACLCLLHQGAWNAPHIGALAPGDPRTPMVSMPRKRSLRRYTGTVVHNPHDEHLRLAWRLCRFGVSQLSDPSAQARVRAWLARMDAILPGSPHLHTWKAIVERPSPTIVDELTGVDDYFSLSPERQGFWRPLVQSQPFSCLLPGRTTRDRRTVLSRLP